MLNIHDVSSLALFAIAIAFGREGLGGQMSIRRQPRPTLQPRLHVQCHEEPCVVVCASSY